MIRDLRERKFGRLTAKTPILLGRVHWECSCSCGKKKIVLAHSLLSGNTKSCGCLHREMMAQRQTKHNGSDSVEYTVWAGMIQRCKNPNHISYKHYGGKGIKVCERWKDFKNFLADMGERPVGNFTIGRKNNLFGYSPDNCQWENRYMQARNHSRNRVITFNGKSQVLNDWAEEIGISPSSLQERLKKWPLENALTEGKKRN